MNLNRMYIEPTRETEPTILAQKLWYNALLCTRAIEIVHVIPHANASKRGVFIYGNRCDGIANQIENMLFVRLMTPLKCI